MLREVYEQPEAVRETIGDRARRGKLVLEDRLDELEIQNLRRIVVVACGTAYHAGVVGRYIIEEWARVPVEPDIRERVALPQPVLSKDTLVIGITQSGETPDTIAAMRLAREQGRDARDHHQLGTQITREVDASSVRGGLEVGVAATKTFTAQVALLSLIALKLARSGARCLRRRSSSSSKSSSTCPRRWSASWTQTIHRGDRAAALQQAVLPLPGATYRSARRPRRGAEAEGDPLHPDRGVLGRRDEARPDRLLDSETPVVCIAIDQKVVYEKVVSTSRR